MLILIRCPLHPHVTAWHVKDPGHFAKSAGGRLHLNTHTPLTHRSRSGLIMPLSRHSAGTYGNELTRKSTGNTRSQSSQLTEPLWTDFGLKNGISVLELISTLKKKKRRRRLTGRTFYQILASEEKATTKREAGGG